MRVIHTYSNFYLLRTYLGLHIYTIFPCLVEPCNNISGKSRVRQCFSPSPGSVKSLLTIRRVMYYNTCTTTTTTMNELIVSTKSCNLNRECYILSVHFSNVPWMGSYLLFNSRVHTIYFFA
jgi:hypothetical protein